MDDDRMSMSSDESDLYDATSSINSAQVQLINQESSTLRANGAAQARNAPTYPPPASSNIQPGRPSIAVPALSRWSAGLWQSVFVHLPPTSLGRLLSVNTVFKSYLDGSLPGGQAINGEAVKTVDAEWIWSRWRVKHAPNMPKPFDGLRERDMWKLVRGIRCEVCKSIDESARLPVQDAWHGGPRRGSSRAIWPFAGRYCMDCCFRFCQKDTAILCTPVKPFLSALPHAFFTQDWHYVAADIVKKSGNGPPGIQISKYYWTFQTEQILEAYGEVDKLGSATTEEWMKGLAGLGRRTMDEAARWEKWESNSGLATVQALLTPPPPLLPTRSTIPPSANLPMKPQTAIPIPTYQPQFHHPQPIAPPYQSFATPASLQTSPVHLGPSPFPHPSMHNPPLGQGFNQVPQFSPQPGGSTFSTGLRAERNVKDVQAAKASRRKTIEDRAYHELQILPNVLRHMESFQAATQISTAMTDNAWEVLKPRLLAQREIAERLEREHTAQLLALQAQNDAQSKRGSYAKDKDAQEREWEDALKPQRARLSAFADAHIKNEWRGGRSINNGNVARFAISLLNAIRAQFYAELAQLDYATTFAGQQIRYDPPDGPYLRRLTLETMKWVYDHKIRPLTRDMGKEIFSCAGDGCEGSSNKLYAYEGAIQHFGAKHTNSFSKGNVIVHWQSAEWPEELPFFDPGSGLVRNGQGNGGHTRPSTTTPQASSGAFTVPAAFAMPDTYGTSPLYGQGYSAPQNRDFHNGHSNGASAAHTGRSPVTQSPAAVNNKYDLSQLLRGGLGAGHLTSTSSMSGAVPASGQAPPALTSDRGTTVVSLDSTRPSATQGPVLDMDMPDFEEYQDQLKFIAECGKHAWATTSTIQGLPQSARMYAVIGHIFSQFSCRFKSELSLEVFTAALTNDALLAPLKADSGLNCRVCWNKTAATVAAEALDEPVGPTMDLTELITHYKHVHVGTAPTLEAISLRRCWSVDMIHVPPVWKIAEAIDVPGLTDEKSSILSDAFPDMVPKRFSRGKDHDSKKRRFNRRMERNGGADRAEAYAEDHHDKGHRPAAWSTSVAEEDQNYRSVSDRRSYEQVAPYSRERTPQLYGGDSDQYDPEKPAMNTRNKQRIPKRHSQHARNDSDQFKHTEKERSKKRTGANPDLATLLASASESARRAAEEENRRRGIEPESLAPAAALREQFVTDSIARDHPQQATLSLVQRDVLPRQQVQYPQAQTGSLGQAFQPQAQVHTSQYSQAGDYVIRASPNPRRNMPQEEVMIYASEPIRARSRNVARYDDMRSQIIRSRSRSPPRFTILEQDGIAQHEAMRQRDYSRSRNEGGSAAYSLPPVEVSYIREPEPIYVDQYGRQVRLVRVDDPHMQGPKNIATQPAIDYVDRRVVYDEAPPRVYYRE